MDRPTIKSQVRSAANNTAMRPAKADVLGALIACSGDDGYVPREGKKPPAVTRLADIANCTARTVRRYLPELARDGWWKPGDKLKRGTVRGQLWPVVKDDSPAVPDRRLCEWDGKPIDHKRADAQFCNDRCRKAAERKLADTQERAARLRAGTDTSPDSVRSTRPEANGQQPGQTPGQSTVEALSAISVPVEGVKASAKADPSHPEKTPLPSSRPDIVSPATRPIKGKITLDSPPVRQQPGSYEGARGKGQLPTVTGTSRPLPLPQTTDHPGHVVTEVEGGEKSGRVNPRGSAGAKIAADRRERLADWYREKIDAGWTTAQMAAELGLTRKAMGGDLKALGISLRRSHVGVTDEFTQQRIRQLAAQGWPVPDIAYETGASIQTTYKYARQVPEFAARVDDYKARVAASRRRRVTRLLAQLREEDA